MEQTAFARMSTSQFQTVTTTVFQLDSGDVIRGKDRQAMARLGPKRRESGASTGVQGQASTSHAGNKIAEMSSKHPEPVQEAGPIYKNIPPEDDSSQIAKIARLARATNANEATTEHAIPGIRQIQLEGIGDSTKDIKTADNQTAESFTTLVLSDNDPCQSLASIDTYANPPQSSPKGNSSSRVAQSCIIKLKATRRNPRKSYPPARASLEQSRPWRSARKTSTSHPTAEVDWSEGIRPTDDEKSPNDKKEADKGGASRGTSLFSPDAESEKSSRKKRKAPKAKSDSAKRRKATKKKGSISAQLPLATNINDKSLPETDKVDAQSVLELPDERPDNACIRDALDMPAASFSIIDKHDDELEVVSSSHEIVELSSDSLLQSNLSSLRQGTGSPRINGQTAMANSHGRGVTLGQKLTDALREAGLNSQFSPEVESRFSPTQITVGGTASGIPRGNFTQPTKVPAARSPFNSELEVVQDGTSDTSSAGEQKNLNEPDEISAPGTHTHQTTSISLRTAVPPTRHLSDTQKQLHIAGLMDRKGDGDDPQNPMVIPDDSSVAHLSDAMEMNPMQLPHAAQDNPQEDLQRLEDELETSSLSSEIPLPDGITMLPVEGGESEHTPESQKPLLSAHTGLQQIAPLTLPKSITRSSIVDRNGSPRLRPQNDIKTGKSRLNIDHFLLQNIRVTDSSSSECDEDSDGYYSESKHQSGGGWSKYQRDMFMEYGISPEELTTDLTGRALFGDAVKVASCAGLISKATTADVTELPRADKRGDYNLVGSGATGNDRAYGIPSRSFPRSIDAPRMEASHDEQNVEKRLSTLMQGDLNNMNWITDLQVAQQSAHNLLLATNQNLSSQLAAEQDTIRQVLHIYRQGCNRILDDLFRAQEVRMQLYRQQMLSVKEQHTQICQEMIQGLQELDHGVQQGL
ncbi:uncharacterized protein N7473_008470 [Penicillium subrubescens]|uniref:Uncharacterized protein n=1 Tax=Penicillium subrubescens TaxID=1316194 RepID=A0A1Q5TEQ6_9EURO|nr:uncharacterized protein N7473_008470 [Penicillium subrubescens]KAJ5892242.1 hypothetical protein N7473_008470 [Penicillium subrubescens]OKO98716.1 hypothetical protein PENSUB_8967 [Penicillium subrubescens]